MIGYEGWFVKFADRARTTTKPETVITKGLIGVPALEECKAIDSGHSVDLSAAKRQGGNSPAMRAAGSHTRPPRMPPLIHGRVESSRKKRRLRGAAMFHSINSPPEPS